jgi:hypothetical protein
VKENVHTKLILMAEKGGQLNSVVFIVRFR